jgi:hypothetical protein
MYRTARTKVRAKIAAEVDPSSMPVVKFFLEVFRSSRTVFLS